MTILYEYLTVLSAYSMVFDSALELEKYAQENGGINFEYLKTVFEANVKSLEDLEEMIARVLVRSHVEFPRHRIGHTFCELVGMDKDKAAEFTRILEPLNIREDENYGGVDKSIYFRSLRKYLTRTVLKATGIETTAIRAAVERWTHQEDWWIRCFFTDNGSIDGTFSLKQDRLRLFIEASAITCDIFDDSLLNATE